MINPSLLASVKLVTAVLVATTDFAANHTSVFFSLLLRLLEMAFVFAARLRVGWASFGPKKS